MSYNDLYSWHLDLGLAQVLSEYLLNDGLNEDLSCKTKSLWPCWEGKNNTCAENTRPN